MQTVGFVGPRTEKGRLKFGSGLDQARQRRVAHPGHADFARPPSLRAWYAARGTQLEPLSPSTSASYFELSTSYDVLSAKGDARSSRRTGCAVLGTQHLTMSEVIPRD